MSSRYDKSFTKEELEKQADELALRSSLRTTGRDAYNQIQAGALDGTWLASKLKRIFFLIDNS